MGPKEREQEPEGAATTASPAEQQASVDVHSPTSLQDHCELAQLREFFELLAQWDKEGDNK